MIADWASLSARIKRIERQRRIARFLLRLLRLGEVEVLPIGEYSVAFGYVTLTNDMRPVIDAARSVATDWAGDPDFGPALDRLTDAITRFDTLYPEQKP